VRITLIAVGALKEPHWRAAADEYLKRLRPYATVSVVEVADRDISRDPARALAEEGAGILKALPPGASVVALDSRGTQMSSEALAEWLQRRMVAGESTIAFVVGGSAGLAPEVLERAAERLSLGPMTLPHQLARVVLLEQLYRGFKIVRGEPYHL
jgi:23S rRNA (pseudouridine1915-N3)-methyltransferase